MGAVRDLTGQRFGRLVVVERIEPRGGVTRYRCLCDCGTVTIVRHGPLTTGDSKSCGCIKDELLRKPRRSGERGMKHGMRQAPEYKPWCAMRERCLSPGNKDFPRWGGRGITIDPRWSDFATFLADVGPRPGPEYSLHRKDNSGNYEPGNVVWALAKEQARNRRPAKRGIYVTVRLTPYGIQPVLPAPTHVHRIYGLQATSTKLHASVCHPAN